MVEGDGARPRGAAHKICLHSPEKKSTDLAGESGEERGKTKVGPKTVVRFEDGGEEEEKQLS